MAMDILFWFTLSLLFLHEMDAVRNREWRLFAFLNKLDDRTAFQAFTLAHLPLYIFIFFLLSHPSPEVQYRFQLFGDIFFVVHLGLHLLFTPNPANDFTSAFSKGIIRVAGICGALHAALLITA